MAVFTGTTADGKPLLGVAHKRDYREFPEKSSFPWLLELLILFEDRLENGMPTSVELFAIEEFQTELLIASASVTTVHKIGHVTGNDAREFFCYLPEPASANALLTMLTHKPSKREFQFSITSDRDWSFAKTLGI